MLFFFLPLYTKAQGCAWLQWHHGDEEDAREETQAPMRVWSKPLAYSNLLTSGLFHE